VTIRSRNRLAALIIGAGLLTMAAGSIAVAASVVSEFFSGIQDDHFPDALALSPDGRTLYVGNANAPAANGVVWPLDLATGHRGHPIRVHGPAIALAMAPSGRTLYSSDGDTITPIDLATGRTGPPIRAHTYGFLFPPLLVSRDGGTLYIAGGSHIRKYDLAARRFDPGISTDYPRSMLFSKDGKTLWYAPFDHHVVAVNLATRRVKERIRVRSEPLALAMSPNGRRLYVAVAGSGRKVPAEVVPINLATGSVGPGTKVSFPVAMAMAPNGRTLYVLATPQGTEGDGPTVRGWITPIDLGTGKARRPVSVGYAPTSIVITPNGKTLYVTNEDGGSISVIHLSGQSASHG
jgi:DNA-binding beta-propeller fold protein YncE